MTAHLLKHGEKPLKLASTANADLSSYVLIKLMVFVAANRSDFSCRSSSHTAEASRRVLMFSGRWRTSPDSDVLVSAT